MRRRNERSLLRRFFEQHESGRDDLAGDVICNSDRLGKLKMQRENDRVGRKKELPVRRADLERHVPRRMPERRDGVNSFNDLRFWIYEIELRSNA